MLVGSVTATPNFPAANPANVWLGDYLTADNNKGVAVCETRLAAPTFSGIISSFGGCDIIHPWVCYNETHDIYNWKTIFGLSGTPLVRSMTGETMGYLGTADGELLSAVSGGLLIPYAFTQTPSTFSTLSYFSGCNAIGQGYTPSSAPVGNCAGWTSASAASFVSATYRLHSGIAWPQSLPPAPATPAGTINCNFATAMMCACIRKYKDAIPTRSPTLPTSSPTTASPVAG